ncbi:uncharacterized protein LOC142320402 [Lycorma delicatula]|uniref:uncharacterized protein LOC142320402 n=1 Tax=Lycorma delicatula TaxID=130591 RepID=UPI003F51679E
MDEMINEKKSNLCQESNPRPTDHEISMLTGSPVGRPMDYIDSEQIILEIEKYPHLYDTTNEKYKDRNEKQEAWGKVAEAVMGEGWKELGAEEKNSIRTEIQRRWKCLKDAFLRSLRLQGTPNGPKKKYVFHKQMAFLLPTIQSQKIWRNLNNPESKQLTLKIMDDSTQPSNCVSTSLQPENSAPPAKQRKKSDESFEREPVVNVLHEVKSKSDDNNNPDKLFLLSILPRIQELNNSDKLDFQIKVMQLLKQYTDASGSQNN